MNENSFSMKENGYLSVAVSQAAATIKLIGRSTGIKSVTNSPLIRRVLMIPLLIPAPTPFQNER